MSEDQSLGQLIREFIEALGAYLRQSAADSVREILAAPLRGAAKKVGLLALTFALVFMGALFLVLAAFNGLLLLPGGRITAYGVVGGVCLLLGLWCASVVRRDEPKQPSPAAESDNG